MTDTLDIKISKTASSRLDQVDFNDLGFGKIFSDHMFVADYADGQWKNFEIIPYGDLSFSPAISVLHYGQAFFEGLKAYKHADGKVTLFRPYKNAERFNRSAERLSMPVLPEDIFVQSIAALVDIDSDWIPAESGRSLYIRPFMFATDPYLGVRPALTYKYMVLTGPAGAYYSEDLKVKVETKYSRAGDGGFGFAKAAGNYAGSLLPAKEAVDQGFDQLIWTDSRDHAYIEELGTANIMFIINDKLVTPSTRDTILKGVTRDTIIILAKEFGIEVEERRVSVAEIIVGLQNGSVTEAFGVGTAATITKIASISFEGKQYELPDPGNAAFANRTLKALNDIRYGLAPDSYGWNYTV